MSGESDNIMLVLLRQMDAKLDRVVEDLRGLKLRVTAIERRLNLREEV